MFIRKAPGAWLYILASVVLAGCAARVKPAVYSAPQLQWRDIGQIVMLPAVDARIDKQISVDLDDQLAEAAVSGLERRGYTVVLSPDPGSNGPLTEEGLAAADAAWIKRLGPPDARYVMVVTLLDVTTQMTFGSTGNAEVEGFLYDKERGALLWRDKGIGQVGQGGLLGMALVGAMDNAAIATAVTNLIASVPEHPE